jgi:PKD repeat protein
VSSDDVIYVWGGGDEWTPHYDGEYYDLADWPGGSWTTITGDNIPQSNIRAGHVCASDLLWVEGGAPYHDGNQYWDGVGACYWPIMDVPWLFEDPITGTVPADGGLAPVDVTLNAAYVAQPGEYYATLNVNSDDPVNNRISIPVTMTVNVPETWGKLQGVVYGLGHCDVNPTLLEGAEVLIEGHPLTLTTDVSGTYAYWLEQGTYTVTVSYAEYLTDTAVVNVTAQATTTHDVELRWLRPCVSVAPLSMEATVLSYSYWATTLNADPELSSHYTFVNLGNDWTYATIQDYAGILVNENDHNLMTGETAALRQYYDAGGAILLGMDDVDDEGATEQADVYYVFGVTNAQDGDFYVGTLNPAHPIAQGVTLSNVGVDNDHFDQDGATWVVKGNDGNDYVLARDGRARTVIFGEQLSQWWGYGNQQLVRNAIEWAMPFDVDWLSEKPITGTMSADSTFPVEITFTASPTRPTGVYTATLIVQTGDPVNDEINVPVTMTVVTAPDCGFTTSSPDDLGETTYFTNTSSSAPPLTHRWDFGDDGPISTAAHPTHTYAHVGFYTAVLTATNPYSQSVCTDIVSIEGVEGGFVSNSPVMLGAPMVFTNTTLSNPPIAHYFWAFGDSGSSEDEHPLHTYAAPGIYTVTLIAANTLHTPNNAYDIYQDSVEVSEPFYGVMLAPSTNAKSGEPGSTVIYTLRMTNIGNTVDTLTIASSGNAWTTEAVATVGPLASGESADVQVVVHIPAGANEGEHDTVTTTATSQGNGAESDNSVLTTTVVTAQPSAIYLPLVMRRHISTPDLVVDSLIATSDAVTVTIRNQGTGPVSVEDEFWVDVYINPDIEPTHVNQTWEHVGSQGLVWGVTESALPLYPGEALTLTVSDDYHWPDMSQVSWPLPAGTPVWAQVDSANADTDYGAVLENHEITGGEYNNVSGPVLSTATFGATGDRRLFDRPGMRPARHGNLPRRH